MNIQLTKSGICLLIRLISLFVMDSESVKITGHLASFLPSSKIEIIEIDAPKETTNR